jgi:hypothetical protein
MMQRPRLVVWWWVLCSILVSSESEYSVIASILLLICGNPVAVIKCYLPSYCSNVEINKTVLTFHLEMKKFRTCMESVNVT